MSTRTREIALTAVYAALATILEFLPIDVPFPLFPKLTIDITGVPLLLALYTVGLRSSTAATVITGVVIALPRPPFKGPNPYGAFFKASAELATIVGIYFLKRYWKGKESRMLYLSIIGGSASRSAIMAVVNYVFLPVFYSLPMGIVISIIPITIVFNVIQAVINIVVAYFVLVALRKRIPQL